MYIEKQPEELIKKIVQNEITEDPKVENSKKLQKRIDKTTKLKLKLKYELLKVLKKGRIKDEIRNAPRKLEDIDTSYSDLKECFENYLEAKECKPDKELQEAIYNQHFRNYFKKPEDNNASFRYPIPDSPFKSKALYILTHGTKP